MHSKNPKLRENRYGNKKFKNTYRFEKLDESKLILENQSRTHNREAKVGETKAFVKSKGLMHSKTAKQPENRHKIDESKLIS